jgi:hypothetical protein
MVEGRPERSAVRQGRHGKIRRRCPGPVRHQHLHRRKLS